MDRQTLRDWVHRYNAEGLAGLRSRKPPGPSPKLTAQQEAELAALVEAGPDPAQHGVVRWRRIDLRNEIGRRFGVTLHERSVGTVLAKLGHRVAAGLVMPTANAETMSLHLDAISRKVVSGAHAILVFDGAGYHGAGANTLRATRCFCCRFEQSDTEENSVVAEGENLERNLLQRCGSDALAKRQTVFKLSLERRPRPVGGEKRIYSAADIELASA